MVAQLGHDEVLPSESGASVALLGGIASSVRRVCIVSLSLLSVLRAELSVLFSIIPPLLLISYTTIYWRRLTIFTKPSYCRLRSCFFSYYRPHNDISHAITRRFS